MRNYVADFVAGQPAARPALITRDASVRRVWTFGELITDSGLLAARLVAAGAGPGSVVMTLLGNRAEYCLSVLASLRVGAAVLPCSEQLRAGDLRIRLAAARPVVVICDERNLAQLTAAAPDCPIITVPWRLVPAPAPVPVPVPPSAPSFVLFTSGTSGEPKLVSHGQRYLWGQRVQAEHWLGVADGEVFWSTASPGWSKSARNGFIAPWFTGGVALLHDARFDPEQRLAVLAEESVAVLCMAPTEYRMLAADTTIAVPASLRRLVTAGEALTADTVATWRDRTGLVIADGYGQTETGQLTSVRPGDVAPAGSMGRALPGVNTRIVDGELQVEAATAPTFFLGYGFPAGPAADPDGWWRTGDRVDQDDAGYLYFRSRADDVIISAGYRIGPEEVESALAAHPAVRDCAVIGVPDAIRGQVVCAVVVPAAGAVPGDELRTRLADHVKERTAPYKYPRVIHFVDALPKTTSGKTARGTLRATYS